MSAPQALRAPVPHRVVAATACPVVAYFVARLLLRLTGLPSGVTYAVCLAVGVLVGYRALATRVELAPDAIRVHNSLASSTISRATVRRVNDSGRIECRDAGSPRTSHLPADALHQPWWAFGSGKATYAVNQEQVRSWIRVAPARAEDGDSLGDSAA
ncbi:hypothetical protein [Humibacillus sp. DSM 29435]|uniref:hypothetical protein n=1 Tax=Humibacillus sp. DSM 29435 TaxID=1869167 RepID=UPI0020C7E8E1|nr:hypothetical protein [Humibacillus sp. DSM 29435]